MNARDRFWDIICSFQPAVRILVAIDLALLVLTVFAFLGASPWSGPYVVSLLNFAIIGATLAGAAYVFWRC